MRKIKKLLSVFLIAALLFFVGAGAASAFDDEEEEEDDGKASSSGGNVMDGYVNNMSPELQPGARLISKNLPYVFALAGVGFLLYDGLRASREKGKDHLDKSADHKNSQIVTAQQLGLTLILVSIFVAVLKNNSFGII